MRFSLPRISAALQVRMLFAAVMVAVPLAAFLSFSIQPLVAKALLPAQGGAASTWLGAMVYFQCVLLCGYAWAAWLLRRSAEQQVLATVALALVGSALARPEWMAASGWTGLGGIVLTLAVATAPAMVLLFSIGPLMHGWLGSQGRAVPYYLYACSSGGSLLAVVLYPFTIERTIGLSDQIFFWRGLLWVLGGCVAFAGACFRRLPRVAEANSEAVEAIPASRVALWIGVSALGCVGMLGATHHLAAEIGSSPIAWVGPFGAYILSFVVIFSGWWHPRFTLVSLAWLGVSLVGFMLTKGVSNATVDGVRALWVLSLTAAGSFFANGLLHEARPTRRFAYFYLIVAVGGVVGGLLASVIAPVLFLRPSEFMVVSALLLTFGLVRLLARREVLPVAVVAIVVLAPVGGLVIVQSSEQQSGAVALRRFRNIYGYMLLEQRKDALILSSETTTHGSQMTADAAARRRPTLYYSESSGVGRMIEEAQKKSPGLKMAAVGLGAGTLAAYARNGDVVDFWDIDPKAIRVAKDFFSYVTESHGRVSIHPLDGRKGLEQSQEGYDLIVIDAFCGDAIPYHLLTREALAIYFRRLDERAGVLAVHTSNRYSNLFPVIGATAHTLGWVAINVATDIAETTPERDWDADGRVSQYVLLCRPTQVAEVLASLPAEEDEGRVRRTVEVYDPIPPGRAVFWTDERHAALDCLDLRRYLTGR